MSKPRLLLTGEVLLPFLRDGKDKDMRLMLMLGRAGEFKLFITPQGMSVLAENLREDRVAKVLNHLLKVVKVVSVGNDEIRQAVRNVVSERFDDALMEACAVSIGANAIVANRQLDSVPCFTPKEFFQMLEDRFGIRYVEIFDMI